MLRNFISIRSLYRGKDIVELYFLRSGMVGAQFVFFNVFCKQLVDSNYSGNTIGDYIYRVMTFLDYIFTGLKILGASELSVKTLYLCYGDYLIYGGKSTTSIVIKINDVKCSPMISRNSAIAYHDAVKVLVDVAARQKLKFAEYSESGIDVEDTSQHEVVVWLSSLVELKTIGVKKAPTADTGSFSEKLKNKASLTAHMGVKSSLIIPPKFFPLECISALIDTASCHRDAALWALLAGVGIRESEADQILQADIDFSRRTVLIIDPRSRERSCYVGLSEREVKKLEWKGRNTPLTVFLEPYGRLFFEHLEQYQKHEAKAGVSHDFVFQSDSGKPLFLSDYCSEIYRPFVRAAKITCKGYGIDYSSLAPHSLRHSYIYFMKNYVEHASGIGLDDFELMALTGHTSVEALRVYAVTDYEKLLEKIYFANISRRNNNPESELGLRIKYLEERLADFRASLDRSKLL
ncbi:integrase [Pseudomonas sp. BS3782 TE3695]|uniref:tyrosine-type recombinase/integrase n=1 Tax=Pseudomonas sp. BS3782 TE3695 TaxID=3349323 RepID=UPI003D23CCF1